MFVSLLVLGVTLVFSTCNKNNSFVSKKAMEKRLLGKWNLQPLLPGEGKEIWNFKSNGAVVRTDPNGEIIDQGAFEVHARPVNSKITITEMEYPRYNGKWFVVNLRKNILQLNNNEPCPEGIKHCGTFEREFYR